MKAKTMSPALLDWHKIIIQNVARRESVLNIKYILYVEWKITQIAYLKESPDESVLWKQKKNVLSRMAESYSKGRRKGRSSIA